MTGLHIHSAPPGANGGVVFGILGLMDDGDDLVVNAGAGTVSGCWDGADAPNLAASLATLKAGGLYFNVHTQAFAGGEIRGQILETPLFADGFESGNAFEWSSQVP